MEEDIVYVGEELTNAEIDSQFENLKINEFVR